LNPIEDETGKLGQFRIIQAEQRYRSALRWLELFDVATWPEVRTFLSSYCPPGETFEMFLLKFRSWEGQGKQPADVHEDGKRLDDELRLAMAEMRKGFDSLSLIGSVISPLDEGDSLPFRMVEPVLLDPFQGSGGFLTITGPPRKGKTGFACLVMEAWLRADPRAIVLSNVIMSHAVDRIIEVPGVKALQEQIIKAVIEKRRWLWVFDDAGLKWLKQRAMLGTNIDLEQFARIVPKHGGSFIYIDQREGGIPTTIGEFSDSRVRCLRPGFALAHLPDFNGSVRDIPKPTTPYVSEARSAFLMDSDIHDLIEAIPRPEQAVKVV